MPGLFSASGSFPRFPTLGVQASGNPWLWFFHWFGFEALVFVGWGNGFPSFFHPKPLVPRAPSGPRTGPEPEALETAFEELLLQQKLLSQQCHALRRAVDGGPPLETWRLSRPQAVFGG